VPVECRRRLKQLLGGAELYTKPKRRENQHGQPRVIKVQKHKEKPALAVAKEKPTAAIVRDPPAAIPPTSSTLQPPQSPKQIHISLGGRKPLSPELVPLSKDKDVLIPPGQLQTGPTPPPLRTTKKIGPTQLPTQIRVVLGIWPKFT